MFELRLRGSKFTLLVQVWNEELSLSPGPVILWFWCIWSLFLMQRKLDLFLKHKVMQTILKLLVSCDNFKHQFTHINLSHWPPWFLTTRKFSVCTYKVHTLSQFLEVIHFMGVHHSSFQLQFSCFSVPLPSLLLFF